MAIDTSGFNLALPQEPIVTPALANVAPLSMPMQGMAWKPLAIQEPSSAVAEGIASALGSIGKGITAAYQNAQEVKKQKADAALKQQQLAASQSQHAATLGMAQARMGMEQQRLDIEAKREDAYERHMASLPAKFKPGTPFVDAGEPSAPLQNMAAPDTSSQQLDEEVYKQFPSIRPSQEKYDRDFTQPLNALPEPDATDMEQSPSLEINKSPLGSLSEPVSPVAMSDLGQGMGLPDLSQVSAKYLEASANGVPPTSPLAGIPPLSARQAELLKAKTFGSESIPDQIQAEKQLKSLSAPEPETQAVAAAPIPGPFKNLASAQAEAAKEYPGYEPRGAIKYDHTMGGYVVERPAIKQETIEAQEQRKAHAKETEETAKERVSLRRQSLIDSEASKFYQHPGVKAFTSPNGMQQSFSRFVKDYEAIKKNPEAAGVSDIGLLDMFARAEGGGRVTEGQANLVLQSANMLDKAKLLGMRLEGGDRLSQNQRDQMLRVIAEDHDAQAKIANQAVSFYRNKLAKQGITDESDLPQYFIPPVTKEDATNHLNEMRSQALALKAQKDAAAQQGNSQLASELEKKLEDIGRQAKGLSGKLHAAKGTIINMDEIENTPQGWGGGAVMAIPTQPAAQ